MRSEHEMLDLILDSARSDDRIRGVIMNGSRVNPTVPRDPFQDFDVVFLVSDVTPYRYNPDWIASFGELLILQMPEAMGDPPPEQDGSFAYLMQFTDGNRIDLTIAPIEDSDNFIQDSLNAVLMDKDGLFQNLLPANDRDYLTQPPSAKAFADCCNEFWWICPYVAKGLWRGQILYAKLYQERYLRDQLMKMITWYAGIQSGFSQSPGKGGKFLQDQLEPELWHQLLRTHSDADYERTWTALFAACDLFRDVSTRVAEHFGFEYPIKDDQRVSAHLEHIQDLPGDAEQIY
jgi:aminoglycoside 6-adenylyltransferase